MVNKDQSLSSPYPTSEFSPNTSDLLSVNPTEKFLTAVVGLTDPFALGISLLQQLRSYRYEDLGREELPITIHTSHHKYVAELRTALETGHQ